MKIELNDRDMKLIKLLIQKLCPSYESAAWNEDVNYLRTACLELYKKISEVKNETKIN